MSVKNNIDFYTRFPLWKPSVSALPKLSKAYIQISLKSFSEENLKLIESFLMLEWLTNQRPFIKSTKFVASSSNVKKLKLSTKSRNRSLSNKSLCLQLLLHCTVRADRLDSLVNFLNASFLELRDKYLDLSLTLNRDTLYFSIPELDFFVTKPEYLREFLPISFYLFIEPTYTNLFSSFPAELRLLFLRDFWSLFQTFHPINSWDWRTV